MEEPKTTARPTGVRWRAILEISIFAVAATVLVTGVDLTAVRRALARLPGPSVSQPGSARAPAPRPAASPRPAAAKKAAPAKVIAPPATPSVKKRTQAAPARLPAPFRPAAGTAPRPSTLVEEPAAAPSPLGEVARIQHFYALMDKGIALYNEGWYGPAVGRFRQAAAIVPKSPYVHLWWGRAALAAGRPEEARDALERAIALAPGTEVARKAQLLLQSLN